MPARIIQYRYYYTTRVYAVPTPVPTRPTVRPTIRARPDRSTDYPRARARVCTYNITEGGAAAPHHQRVRDPAAKAQTGPTEGQRSLNEIATPALPCTGKKTQWGKKQSTRHLSRHTNTHTHTQIGRRPGVVLYKKGFFSRVQRVCSLCQLFWLCAC